MDESTREPALEAIREFASPPKPLANQLNDCLTSVKDPGTRLAALALEDRAPRQPQPGQVSA